MDGYAVRAADTPARLRIVGIVAAGRPETRRLGVGEAMDISTGGVVPEGADAVVPVERVVVVSDGEVEIPDAVASETTSGSRARTSAPAMCCSSRVRC